MGKAKKRNFQNCINSSDTLSVLPQNCRREEAINYIMQKIEEHDFGAQTKDMIGLFGITEEELSEAGATFEDLKALKSVFI